jgi:hypothetical protein
MLIAQDERILTGFRWFYRRIGDGFTFINKWFRLQA